jgi:hypothetical protein
MLMMRRNWIKQEEKHRLFIAHKFGLDADTVETKGGTVYVHVSSTECRIKSLKEDR